MKGDKSDGEVGHRSGDFGLELDMNSVFTAVCYR